MLICQPLYTYENEQLPLNYSKCIIMFLNNTTMQGISIINEEHLTNMNNNEG